MQSSDQEKLSECEVAQLERLIRRMDDWQRGWLWSWLNGGFLSDCSLWGAVNGKLPLPPGVIERKEKVKKAAEEIDSETCEIFWKHTEVLDPYGDHPVPPVMSCVGRDYFVRNKGGDTWVWDGDLPKDKLDALRKRIDREREAAMYDVHDLISPKQHQAIYEKVYGKDGAGDEPLCRRTVKSSSS
jgi:hypothetical protein